MNIEIISSELTIKKFSLDLNLDNYLEMLNDENVTKYLESVVASGYVEKDLIEYINSYEGILLSVLLKNAMIHIGNIGITDINNNNKSCNIGVMFHPKYYGQGYAYNSLKMTLKYIFNKMNIHRVYLYVGIDNFPAIKLDEKLGFKREGIQRDGMCKLGRVYDMYIYSLLSTD